MATEVRPPLTIIAGPTATGKSALAVRLAEAAGGEIVGADSQQVYRHFDVGTAKPTAEERARVPHHLISVVEPADTFSAARYQTLADEAIAQIAQRGARVFVVGGTGLYLRILLHGVVRTPGADPDLRARLMAEADAHGASALHARLAAVDPDTARALAPADLVRVVRALEIFERTGRPASAWRAEHRFEVDRYPFVLYVLAPPRELLYRAIDDRARAMFEGGLIEETRRLVAAGFRDTAPMRSVGYRQALAVVDGRLGLAEAVASCAQETRRYAKRQLTWFRREARARFLSPPYAEIS